MRKLQNKKVAIIKDFQPNEKQSATIPELFFIFSNRKSTNISCSCQTWSNDDWFGNRLKYSPKIVL
jgi:hypothetical protein